jgi:hypothetical protein
VQLVALQVDDVAVESAGNGKVGGDLAGNALRIGFRPKKWSPWPWVM